MQAYLETITKRIEDIDNPRLGGLHAMEFLIRYFEYLLSAPYEGHIGYWHMIPGTLKNSRKAIENAVSELTEVAP